MPIYIQLNSIQNARDFVGKATVFTGDVTLVTERGRIDGKSLINILSTDIRQPMELQMWTHRDDNKEAFLESIKEYIVDAEGQKLGKKK